MFEKLLKLNVLKKHNNENPNHLDKNPQLQKLLNKFDNLEQELILRGENPQVGQFIPHPLKTFNTYDADVVIEISKDLLKHRGEDITSFGRQVQFLIDGFSTQLCSQSKIIINFNEQAKAHLAVVRIKQLKNQMENDSELLKIFKQWKMISVNNRSQLSIERELDGSVAEITVIISVPKKVSETRSL